MPVPLLELQQLTKQAFARFGHVIEADGNPWFPINRGTTRRFDRLGRVQAIGDGAEVAISLFRCDAVGLPVDIRLLERHPLGSQCFLPMCGAASIVVVAPSGGDRPDESAMCAFLARGDQGVNYAPGTWHHPLMSLRVQGDFAVVDRVGPGSNCDEVELSQVYRILELPAGIG